MGEKTPEAMAYQKPEGLRKATEAILSLFSYISSPVFPQYFKATPFAISVLIV